MHARSSVTWWLPVIAWAALIFTLSSISLFPAGVRPLLSWSSFWHCCMYAVLAFLCARAFDHTLSSPRKQSVRFFAVLLAIAYAFSDEYHQSFVPLRDPSIVDIAYDSIGAVIGALSYRGSGRSR